MGIISSLAGAVATGGASIGAKIMSYVIGAVILTAIFGGAYFYIHEKNLALAKAQNSLTQAQSQLVVAVAANGADVQTIAALRAQQVQDQAAQMAMDIRDRISQGTAATIQTLIDRESGTCATLPSVSITANPKLPIVVAKDNTVAPVLSDALAALAAVQAGQGKTP